MARRLPFGLRNGARLPWLTLVLLLGAFAGAEDSPAATAPASPPVHEQPEWLIRTWETEDGLPENSATAMVQTSDHYLWFGTFNGLVRFDGVTFTVFDSVNTPILPNSGIVNLHLDRAERLWVSTLGGLVWREGNRWSIPPGSNVAKDDFVRTFSERSNGDLLITTFRGGVLEFTGGQLRTLPPPPGAAGRGYFGGVDDAGRWLVVQHGFVGFWTGRDWVSLISPAELPTQAASRVGCTAAREGGNWILLDSELRRFVGGREVARRPLPETRGILWSLFEDSRSNVWMCATDLGVLQVRPDGSSQWWTNRGTASFRSARFVFEDRESNLWIGTSGGGLSRFKSRRFGNVGLEDGLAERVVKTVWPSPDQGMWLGTYGGGLYRTGERGTTRVALPMAFPLGRYVQSVLTDRHGRTWVGTYADGLFLLDGGSGRAVPQERTGGANVIALAEDSRGRVWISGGKGVAVFQDGIFEKVEDRAGRPFRGVWCFGEDGRGRTWFSSSEGVFRRQGDHVEEVRFPDDSAIREIVCIYPEHEETVWLGSLNSGLYRWRPGSVRQIGPSQGLPVGGIYAILDDDEGACWMASNRGIVRATRQSLNALADGTARRFEGQLFDRSDGLPSVECPSGQQPTAARDGQGRLWFATAKGGTFVDPKRLRLNAVAPPAAIQSLAFHLPTVDGNPDGQPERTLSPPFEPEPRLPAGSRLVEIHYSAPSFTAPEKVRFQVRLEGTDPDWREVGTRRIAYFENLNPGRYVFQVRAANDDGIWSPDGARLAFVVLPYFWQTGWFKLMAVLLLAGALAGWTFRIRAGLERQRAAQASFTRQLIASQEAERSRLARELHDDITQRLARLAIDAGQVERGSTDAGQRQVLGEVREGLARLSEDVHALSYRLHPSILEDLGLVEALRAEAERLRRRSALAVQLKISGLPAVVPRDPALCLFRVAEEALQNAVRHANARSVDIFLRGLDGGLQLAIQDDGSGFDPARPRPKVGLGLTGMRERVDLLGGQLDIESAPGEGTAVIVWLPLREPLA